MMRSIPCISICFPLMLILGFGLASPALADEVSVPFSDSSQPGIVSVSLINGSIAVEGYNGREVEIEAIARKKEDDQSKSGRIKISRTSVGLDVTELNNVMKIRTESHNKTIDLVIRVPFEVNLRLKTVNSGFISVDNVQGEIEANNTNGAIRLTNIDGSVVANTVNGEVKVSFSEFDASKPLHCSTLNGDVVVTLPNQPRADLSLQTTHGNVVSDFEIILDASTATLESSRKDGRQRFRIKKNHTFTGSINGGGQRIKLKTFNGDIVLRLAS